MDSLDLRAYLNPLRKWWWLPLVAAVLAAASSYFYLSQQPPVYRSRTTLMVGSIIQDPNPDNGQFYLAQQLAQTYADIVQQASLREATAAALGIVVLPEYSVRTIPNSQLLEIVVTDTDPLRAQHVAQELVSQLIERSPAGKTQNDRQLFVDQQLAKLERTILETESEIERMQAELATEFTASRLARLQDQIAALDQKLTTLHANYAALLTQTQRGAVNAINVLEPAVLPQRPINDNRSMTVLVAALFGALLALACAYLIEYLDDTVKDSEQIQRLYATPTLGAIPQLAKTETGSDRLVMFNVDQGPAGEAYRVLRTNLQFASVDEAVRLLQVTSATPGEGKSTTAANLSSALAAAGHRVVLVDADFRRPSQHKLFHLVNNLGATTALLSDYSNLDALLRTTRIPNLRVLTSGPLPPNPTELLGSKRMRGLLRRLTEVTDIVVIDSPPVTVVADTAIIATQVDGVLMVVLAGVTRREQFGKAIKALSQVNARLLGVTLNGVSHRRSGYHYDYGYSYGGYYGYGRDGSEQARGRSAEQTAAVESRPSAISLGDKATAAD